MGTHISCAVQAGGQSRRFGRDKALVVIEGETLVERAVNRLAKITDDVMVVGNRLERFARVHARLIADRVDGRGAVGGTFTALLVARYPYVFVAACDMPFLNTELVRYMADLTDSYDVVMPYLGDLAEPMHAIYGKTALPAIARAIQRGERCMLAFLAELKVRRLTREEIMQIDPDFRSFFNVNTPQDLQRAQSILQTSAKKRFTDNATILKECTR